MLELIVAMAIMLTVMAGVLALVDQSQGSFSTQSEVADMQQRLRVAADALYKDLVMAGAGAYQGSNTGSLAYYFAPVLPYRQGSSTDDPPGTFRSDTITLMYVPSTVAQTTLATPGPMSVSGTVEVSAGPGCPTGDALCGFEKGMSVVLYDGSGLYDTFEIQNVGSRTLDLEHNGARVTYAGYQPEVTKIVQLRNVVYYLKSDAATETYQLMRYGGGKGSDAPVLDHLVALTFDYYGEPLPPALTGRALTDPTGPWTTYGPPPPALGKQIPTGGYPEGENCTFTIDATSGLQVSRLPVLTGGATPNTLVQLAPAQLDGSDGGPWCPDPTSANRWDADLLRIRAVGVTIRVESANAALRGPASVLFTHGGTSKGGQRWLPDQEMKFQVTPRNLNLGR
jgi:hypothetical protein